MLQMLYIIMIVTPIAAVAKRVKTHIMRTVLLSAAKGAAA